MSSTQRTAHCAPRTALQCSCGSRAFAIVTGRVRIGVQLARSLSNAEIPVNERLVLRVCLVCRTPQIDDPLSVGPLVAAMNESLRRHPLYSSGVERHSQRNPISHDLVPGTRMSPNPRRGRVREQYDRTIPPSVIEAALSYAGYRSLEHLGEEKTSRKSARTRGVMATVLRQDLELAWREIGRWLRSNHGGLMFNMRMVASQAAAGDREVLAHLAVARKAVGPCPHANANPAVNTR